MWGRGAKQAAGWQTNASSHPTRVSSSPTQTQKNDLSPSALARRYVARSTCFAFPSTVPAVRVSSTSAGSVTTSSNSCIANHVGGSGAGASVVGRPFSARD